MKPIYIIIQRNMVGDGLGTSPFPPYMDGYLQNPSFVASYSMQCFQMITILLNKLRLLTKCMHAVSRYFNPLHTTLNGGGEYLVLICVMQ